LKRFAPALPEGVHHMKKKYKDPAEKQRAYMERKRSEKEATAEAAAEREQCARLDLRFFGESGFEQNAQSSGEEIHIHRQFLRALSQPDIEKGETLRDLARRICNALINAEGIGIDKWSEPLRDKYESGYDVWIPMFNANLQQFDGWHGYAVRGAAKDGWFDTHWSPPKDCTGDESICIEDLPTLPPIKSKRPEPSKAKARTNETRVKKDFYLASFVAATFAKASGMG
jgi:hypothetical protein